jgi:hypothetical protein
MSWFTWSSAGGTVQIRNCLLISRKCCDNQDTCDGGRSFFPMSTCCLPRSESKRAERLIGKTYEGPASDRDGEAKTTRSSSLPTPSSPTALRLDDACGFVYGRWVSLRCSYWVLTLGIAAGAGCASAHDPAPISARATQTLAHAEKAGAERDSPYEYSKAVLYLEQAREAARRSDQQSAAEWSRRSEDCAHKAVKRAKQRRSSAAELPPEYSTCGDS